MLPAGLTYRTTEHCIPKRRTDLSRLDRHFRGVVVSVDNHDGQIEGDVLSSHKKVSCHGWVHSLDICWLLGKESWLLGEVRKWVDVSSR